MSAKDIKTIDEFREAKFERNGYIVIVDITGNKIHTPRCADVDIAHFREKVLNNDSKNGAYYLVDDFVDAIEEFKAKKCQNCSPR